MQIAQTIAFRRAGKGPRRIIANFSSNTDLADIILVSGTEDFRRINKNDKAWNSRCRYSSLQLTLQYLDFTPEGIKIETVSYDKNGNRIATITQDAQIVQINAQVNSNLEVFVGWSSVVELNVVEYVVYKETKGEGDNAAFTTLSPKGVGQDYSALDNSGIRGIFNYSVYASFRDTPIGSFGKLCGTIEDVEV